MVIGKIRVGRQAAHPTTPNVGHPPSLRLWRDKRPTLQLKHIDRKNTFSLRFLLSSFQKIDSSIFMHLYYHKHLITQQKNLFFPTISTTQTDLFEVIYC